jgi:Pentapeptide repeats (8 copies)
MGFFDWFSAPKPAPVVIIRNILGEQIDVVNARELWGQMLRNRDWRHVNLERVCLQGSDLTGTNMLGANLKNASLRNCILIGCEISYADASGCDFSGADMAGCLLYRSETRRARFDNVLLSEHSDIPGRKVFRTMRVLT